MNGFCQLFTCRYIKGANMYLLIFICTCTVLFERIHCITEIIVENPFYVRARIHDSQTATVLFEIAQENHQRTCQRYKFTIRRNREYPYSMPEQNLTFWRNSLELKHLPAGDYRICAIICSEYLTRRFISTYDIFQKKNQSTPISNCVNIHAYRSHFLILTLYILVFIILAFSQMIFTLRKRKIQARIKTALIEVEKSLQKLRATQTIISTPSYAILQSLVTLPAAPCVDPSMISTLHQTSEEHPIMFHLDLPTDSSISEIP